MALICVSPPLMEPVSLLELKQMLRVDQGDTSQDDVIDSLGKAARQFCETITQRRFVQQTWALYIDFFPGYVDQKLVGEKVSSPFVSGSNAVLVGIRYAIVLPFPPVQALVSFVYQNANGQITSMVIGPTDIATISNPSGQLVSITTTTPHGLQTGSGIIISGNAALVALLGNSFQVVTVIDPYTLEFNQSAGTGSSVSVSGSITGYNYIQDLASQPARLTPIFGQMWPVARVVVNAVQVEFTVGYATPISVTAVANTAALSGPSTFTSANVGQPISIPGAGPSGGPLNTIVQSVASGLATLRSAPQTSGTFSALLVNYGTQAHWELIKLAIKFLVNNWYVNRIPNFDDKFREAVRCTLGPVMDLRI